LIIKTIKTLPPERQAPLLNMHNELRAKMLSMPSSVKYHHAFPGGYLAHVGEVVTNIQRLLGIFKCNSFTTEQGLTAAIIHDIDKLNRYCIDTEPPTNKQTSYAKSLGIVILPSDSKTTVSKKIDTKKNGGDPNDVSDEFTYVDREGLSSVGEVVQICAQYGLLLDNTILNAITYHHGGYSDEIRANPTRQHKISDLGIMLHLADYASSHMTYSL